MLYKEGMLYDSYLSKNDYLHWRKNHAIKELISQTISNSGTVTLNDKSCLVLEIPTPIYPPHVIMYSSYEIYHDNPFDIMDAGMKIAIQTLLREKTKFYFMNNLGFFTGLCFLFEFSESNELKEDTMHVFVRHRNELAIMGTRIEIPNISVKDLEKINALGKPDFMIKDKERLRLESKIIIFMRGKRRIKVELDKEIDAFLSQIISPEIRLGWAIFYNMEKWVKKGGPIAFLKECLQEQKIDIRKLAEEKNMLTNEIEKICSYLD